MSETAENMEQNIGTEDKLTRKERESINKRERMAKLNLQLSRLNCRHCNSRGCWKIVKTSKLLRYLQCTACGRSAVVSTSPDANRTLRDSDIAKMKI